MTTTLTQCIESDVFKQRLPPKFHIGVAMMNVSVFASVAAIVLTAVFTTQTVNGGDWPRWNGPTGDGSVPNDKLVNRIPDDGLPLLWKRDTGLGYSGPAIQDGSVIIADYVVESGKVTNNAGRRDELTGEERIRCFETASGDLLWTHSYSRPYAISYPSGPRATPTINQGRVYCLGAEGDLVCLSLKDGTLHWRHQFAEEFGTETPIWGHAASPLVAGNQVICMAGGEGSLVVSYDAKSGDEKWRALSGRDVGYCPPQIITHGGIKQLLVWDPYTLSSLNPQDGAVYWQHSIEPDYGMSVLPPVVDGDLMFVSGEGTSAMYRLVSNPPNAKRLWEGRSSNSMMLATSGAIFDTGHLYGADLRSGALMCVEAERGQRLWQTARATTGSERPRGGAHGSAFLMKHDDVYFILAENGDFISAELSPEAYRETGRFHAIDALSPTMNRTVLWTYPAIADGRLFVRNDKEVRCYDMTP